jgi:hypothetical protein
VSGRDTKTGYKNKNKKKTVNHSTFHGQNHLRADTDSLRVPRKDGRQRLDASRRIQHSKVMKAIDYVKSREDLLIHIVITLIYNTNSALFQIVNNFRKSFQSKNKANKRQNVIIEKWEV